MPALVSQTVGALGAGSKCSHAKEVMHRPALPLASVVSLRQR
jgi:hypothetical protein